MVAFGVQLQDATLNKPEGKLAFFPLPEWEASTEASYGLLPGGLEKDANLINVMTNGLNDWAAQIQTVLYSERDFQGRAVTLPGPTGWGDIYNLGQVDYSDAASSLVVRWKGPPRALGPYSTQYGIDRPGSDYDRIAVAGGPEACESACDRDARCRAFAWVKAGVQGSSALCWLKSEAPAAKPGANTASGVKPGAAPLIKGGRATAQGPTVSGLKLPGPPAAQGATASVVKGGVPAGKGTYEYGVNLPGGDLRGLFVDGGPEACEQACSAEPQCQAFTWVKPGVQGPKAACWLKKSPVPAPQKNPDAVSGYKKTVPQEPPAW
jgi:hypothetical protein